MGLFSRNKGDPNMSRKKRDTAVQPDDTTISDASDTEEEEGAATLEPQRDGETDDEFKARRTAFAQEQLTLAEQQTAALYARQPGESDADYQSRLDEIGVRGQQPAPVDSTYQMPEAPTLDDQRAYLLHYGLVTEDDLKSPQLDAEAIGRLIAQHAADLASRREQAAMRGEVQDLPVNPSLAQLRSYVTTKGLARAELVDTLDVAALEALVKAAPAAPTVDLSAAPPEISDVPYGGDPPKYFVVLEAKNFYHEGSAVSLASSQIVNDRSHDVELLKRLGVRLIETVAPVTVGTI
jgi:hypothetical protein